MTDGENFFEMNLKDKDKAPIQENEVFGWEVIVHVKTQNIT